MTVEREVEKFLIEENVLTQEDWDLFHQMMFNRLSGKIVYIIRMKRNYHEKLDCLHQLSSCAYYKEKMLSRKTDLQEMKLLRRTAHLLFQRRPLWPILVLGGRFYPLYVLYRQGIIRLKATGSWSMMANIYLVIFAGNVGDCQRFDRWTEKEKLVWILLVHCFISWLRFLWTDYTSAAHWRFWFCRLWSNHVDCSIPFVHHFVWRRNWGVARALYMNLWPGRRQKILPALYIPFQDFLNGLHLGFWLILSFWPVSINRLLIWVFSFWNSFLLVLVISISTMGQYYIGMAYQVLYKLHSYPMWRTFGHCDFSGQYGTDSYSGPYELLINRSEAVQFYRFCDQTAGSERLCQKEVSTPAGKWSIQHSKTASRTMVWSFPASGLFLLFKYGCCSFNVDEVTQSSFGLFGLFQCG